MRRLLIFTVSVTLQVLLLCAGLNAQVKTNFSDNLTGDHQYACPNLPGQGNALLAAWTVNSTLHNYAVQKIHIVTGGTYTISTSLSATQPIQDPMLLLYTDDFYFYYPMDNGIVGNDDSVQYYHQQSIISNFTLPAGVYTLVATTFSAGVSGIIDYTINGPATVLVDTGGFPAATTALPGNATTQNFTANWIANSNVSRYILDIATDANFTNILPAYKNLLVGNVTSYLATNLPGATTYYYRIRPANKLGTSLKSNVVSTQIATLSAPTALQANAISQAFTANWSAVNEATNYRLDVATDAGFTKFLAGYNNLSVGNVTSYTISALTNGTTYYYRVRAVNSLQTSANSDVLSAFVSLPTASGKYALTIPQGNEVWTADSYKYIQWKITGGVVFGTSKLELSTNSGATWTKITSSPIAGLMRYSWKVPNISSSHCKIRIANYITGSVYSSTPEFTIIPVSSAAKNYPNPFNPSTKISFSIGNSSNVSLKVFNSIGQQVAELVNSQLNAGIHEYEFNGTNLSSGIYFYNLNIDGHSQVNKMILMK
jgi:hypothetical protein